MHLVTALDIVRILRVLDIRVRNDELAVLRIVATDRVDWNSFPPQPACALPGLDVGQAVDLRYSIHGSEQGLHLQTFPEGHVDAHLDKSDACQSPCSHLVHDTRMIEGVAIGALAGLVLAAMSGDRMAVAPLVALGVGAGGAVGANVARKRRNVFALQDLLKNVA